MAYVNPIASAFEVGTDCHPPVACQRTGAICPRLFQLGSAGKGDIKKIFHQRVWEHISGMGAGCWVYGFTDSCLNILHDIMLSVLLLDIYFVPCYMRCIYP